MLFSLCNAWPARVIMVTASGLSVDSFIDEGSTCFVAPLGRWKHGWPDRTDKRIHPGVREKPASSESLE